MYSQNSHLNNQLKIWLLTLIGLVILIILVGGLTRLTDSGLSITTWELFVGSIPPFTNDKWIDYFELYKTIPEFSEQNYNMTINEFKVIFWWEWGHRQLGRLIGLTVLLPLIFFSIKNMVASTNWTSNSYNFGWWINKINRLWIIHNNMGIICGIYSTTYK